MPKQAPKSQRFRWRDIGDIDRGRPNLGPEVPVAVYRLFQYTLRDELIGQFGAEAAKRLFVTAGKKSGKAFCRSVLDTSIDFSAFVANLQEKMRVMKIGILKLEEADLESMRFSLTVAEDLDCSGLPVSGETVCNYDEGFISGILEEYTGKPFSVKETDCWASGGRVCRFVATTTSGVGDETG